MFKIPQIIKCVISSLFSALVDSLIFQGFVYFLPNLNFSEKISIVIGTIIARIISTAVNFLINKFWSFQSKKKSFKEALLFFLMFLGKMGISAALVAALSNIKIPPLIIKLAVDGLLFFVGYFIQKKFIFVSADFSKSENQDSIKNQDENLCEKKY